MLGSRRLLSFLVPILLKLCDATTLINYGREGDACDRTDSTWYAVPDSDNYFIYCHPKHGVYIRDVCAMADGVRKIFDFAKQQCKETPKNRKPKLKPTSTSKITDPCARHEDCPAHGYCSEQKRCACRLEYVHISGQCFPKLGINKQNCTYHEQCAAPWPNALCVNSFCRCPRDKIAIEINKEFVCGNRDECPLGASAAILLGGYNCRKKGGCSAEGTDMNHFYDCLSSKEFKSSICCPNKAFTCMQPPMPGNGPLRMLRYYYNSVTNKCHTFMYRSGNLVNTNVFETVQQCESYCKKECPRGLPQASYNGRPLTCVADSECGFNYKCHKWEYNTVGTCCPTEEWICSKSGAMVGPADGLHEYDPGLVISHVTAVFYPVIRYYYSEKEARCKAFLFQGEGGNFNRFLTMEQCESFCAPVKCLGAKILRDKSGKIIKCGQDTNCADGYKCSQGVCCTAQAQCPLETEMLFSHTSAGPQPVACSLSHPCPTHYTCELGWSRPVSQSSKLVQGVCCRPTQPVTQILVITMPSTSTTTKIPTTSTTTASTTTPTTTTSTTTTTTSPAPTTTTVSRRCPVGRRPLLDAHGFPIECYMGSILTAAACGTSAEFVCSFNSVNDTMGLCCEAPAHNQFRCPPSLVPVLKKGASRPQACSPLYVKSCADDAVCVFDELYGTYHCCSEHMSDNGCELGQSSFGDPMTNETLECHSMRPNTCPPGFSCHYSAMYDRHQCCGVSAGCPDNSAAFIQPSSQQPLTCGSNGCPMGFFCHRSSKEPMGTCCSEDPIIRLCDHGKALENRDNRGLRCHQGANMCPIGYNCLTRFNISVCCPTSEQVCTQPLDKGLECHQQHQETGFYFDVSSRTCKAFIFSGCGGNDNRFETAAECGAFCSLQAICKHGSPELTEEEKPKNCTKCSDNYECLETPQGNYCCPKPESICAQLTDRGLQCTSAKEQDVWHFDVSVGKCLNMKYKGCEGNLNRFLSLDKCMDVCFGAICTHGLPFATNNDIAQCNDDSQCEMGYQCTAGNISPKNISICCPTRDSLCRQTADPGVPCGTPHFRFHYDTEKKKCERHLYFGCGESQNSFRDKDSCEEFCVQDSNLCSQDSSVYREVSTNLPLACNPLFDTCPAKYACHKQSQSAYYCCSESIKCKSGSRPYRLSDGSPKSCFPGPYDFFDGCPPEHSCQSANDGQYYCCPEADADNACEGNSFPFVHAVTKKPMSCTPGYGSCAFGFECTVNERDGQHYCCSRQVTLAPELPRVLPSTKTPHPNRLYRNFQCNDGSQPYIDQDTRLVRVCNPYLKFSCPQHFKCTFSPLATRYQCCHVGGKSSNSIDKGRTACPSGLRPFLHPRTNQPIVCQPGVAGFCPFTSMCQYSSLYWQFICCSRSIVNTALLDNTAFAPKPTKKLNPGEAGCKLDSECSAAFPRAKCHDWVCHCPDSMKIYSNTCVFHCPIGYVEHGGRCVLRMVPNPSLQ